MTEEPLDDHWQGIVVRPPKCEPLFLTFGRQGKLVNYMNAPSDDLGHYTVIESLWCKTQFGSIQAHIGDCQMLRIVASCARQWKVTDEGGYYETGNQEELEARRGLIDVTLQRLAQPHAIKSIMDQAGVDTDGARPPEVGKVIKVKAPAWRKTWGDEHSEN